MVDTITVVEEIMLGLEAHHNRATVVNFSHDFSFVRKTVGTTNVAVVFNGIDLLPEIDVPTVSIYCFVGVLELGCKEIFRGKFFD